MIQYSSLSIPEGAERLNALSFDSHYDCVIMDSGAIIANMWIVELLLDRSSIFHILLVGSDAIAAEELVDHIAEDKKIDLLTSAVDAEDAEEIAELATIGPIDRPRANSVLYLYNPMRADGLVDEVGRLINE